MKHGFYRRLAAGNLRKNARFFVPRILAETGLLGCFYIALTLATDTRLSKISGGEYIPTLMWIGTAVLAILSAVVIFYANSFLMKQRKREFGLYNVLGLEKKHIGRVLFHEGFFVSTVSLVGGLAWGILLYKLCALLICRLLKSYILIGFYFLTPKSIVPAAVFFLFLDGLAGIVNRVSITRMDPVELLASRKTGEKEPKIKWPLLILGVLSLGGGYYLALTTKNPLEALLLFFAAVVLVMLGTYFLFIAGSIFVLKALKRNKKFYYQKRHMPVIGGLLYRMKQNAVGLASVAILSTGILIMISTTVSLYSGLEGTLRKNYPHDMYLSAVYETAEGVTACVPPEKLEALARAAAEENGIAIASVEKSEYLSAAYYRVGDTLYSVAEAEEVHPGADVFAGITNLVFIDNETYAALTGTALPLENGEIATCRISSQLGESVAFAEQMTVHGKTYRVRKVLPAFPIKASEAVMNGFSTYGVVFASEEALRDFYALHREAYGRNASDMTGRIAVDFSDIEKAQAAKERLNEAVTTSLKSYLAKNSATGIYYYSYNAVWQAREALMGMYGTLLFLGILLGTVCMFATVLILYYKQISEGYEDRERFRIMEQIGMSREEVKKTIGFQVLFVFFLPLVTAAVHVAFAYPMLERMLSILALYSPRLFLTCTLITFAVFALVYSLIYIATSRTYYKIVH